MKDIAILLPYKENLQKITPQQPQFGLKIIYQKVS